jgi:DNA-binding MarR family transcriptional regulator
MEVFGLLRYMRDLFPPKMPLPICECMLLQAISETEGGGQKGRRVSELGAQIHMAMPAASRILGSFEQKGLIVRRIDEGDRRAVYIRLTPEGEQKLEEIRRFVYAHLDGIAQQFGEENICALEKLLRQLLGLIPGHTGKEKG